MASDKKDIIDINTIGNLHINRFSQLAVKMSGLCCRIRRYRYLLCQRRGYLCRRFLKRSKCTTYCNDFLTKVDTSELAAADFINAKTKEFLLYCNLYLYNIFRKTENFFVKNVKLSDCHERMLTDVFKKVTLTFPCNGHKSEILAAALHNYILMRMQHYESEENLSVKKKCRTSKKVLKGQTS